VKSVLFAVAVLTAGPALAAQGHILARCGASHGQAYYAHDKNPTWVSDAIGSGSFIFLVDAAGRPNVQLKDTRGSVYDTRKEDGDVRFAYRNQNDFGIIVTYADQSIIETYNVVTDRAGQRKVLWTSNRGTQVRFPRVGAYEATCQ
jgi:hypothetical protein